VRGVVGVPEEGEIDLASEGGAPLGAQGAAQRVSCEGVQEALDGRLEARAAVGLMAEADETERTVRSGKCARRVA